jgi:4-aminobutyrate---pyruvate transaminase
LALGHGFTYGGHPVCAAVACEAIRIYEDERLIEQAAARGKVLEEQLRALVGHPLVGSIRGAGLMWGSRS